MPHWFPEAHRRGLPDRAGQQQIDRVGGRDGRIPALWLRTTSDLAELSSAYRANCSKCQWLWPCWESNPIVPARTRPMTRPFRQKYW